MADLLSTGISALNTFKRGLDNSANNIANANTPGYSRQIAEFDELPGQTTPFGYVGNGVQVTTIRRAYDQFLALQLQNTVSGQARLDIMDSLATRVDGLLADPVTGLSPRLQGFYDAVQDVSNEPSSIAARQALIGEAQNLVTGLSSIDGRLDALGGEVDARLKESVGEVNRLASSIARLNDEIVLAQNRTSQPANGLLDERDQLLRQLAEKIDISTVVQDDGAISVFVGSGQSLVLNNRAEQLATTPDPFDPTRFRVVYRAPGGDVPLADGTIGGEVGGLLDFRSQILDSARSLLGQTALGLALSVNELHGNGVDLNGNAGQAFFNVAPVDTRVSNSNAGSGVATATVADVASLEDTDYLLTFDGASYSLSRSDTGQSVPMTGTGTALDPFIADGVEIVVSGAPVAGDQIMILATRGAASGIELNVSDPREFAAAFPTRTRVGVGNIGNAAISATAIVDGDDPGLLTTATIEFLSPTTYSINGAGSFAYTSGDPIVVNGSQFSITGVPVAGDQFTLEANTGATGDNRNALLLGGLQTRGILDGGLVSVGDNYAGLVADVGNSVSQIRSNLSAQTILLDNVEADIASKSGVNLDEEAAELIRFQQAYEAAAQIIAVTNMLFDTLLGAVRR